MPEVEQSAWNLSQHIINQIGYLLQTASSKFRAGQIMSAYWDTEEIRTLIHADLDEKEKEKLDEWEIIISGQHSTYKKLNGNILKGGKLEESENNMMKKTKMEHYKNVKKYRMYMMELLSKYGYSVSKKEDSSRMF